MIRKALLASVICFAACDAVQPETNIPSAQDLPAPDMDASVSTMTLKGDIINAEGDSIGALDIVQGPHGLLFEVTIAPGGLTPGWHGLHMHQVGNCDDLGVFKMSGGHVGMIEGGHGLMNPIGPEAGDLPNIWAGADGSAGYEAFTSLTTAVALGDEDGTALIIHDKRDDHISQPIGGAGGRVACAIIK